MENIKKLLGQRIKELRLNKKLSQEKFAEAIGLDQRSVSNIECGNSFPSKSFENIVKVLEIEPKDLFDFKHIELNDEQMAEYISLKLKKLSKDKLRIVFKVVEALN